MRINGKEIVADRFKVLLLILILAIVVVFTTGISNIILYNAAFNQFENQLLSTVLSHSRMMELLTEHELAEFQDGSIEYEPAINLITHIHREIEAFGNTGEFIIGMRSGDIIRFLLNHEDVGTIGPNSITFGSKYSKPMQLALSGQAGTMVALDYHGTKVLAAYKPIPILNMGIVAKIDLEEIQEPFVKAGILTGILALISILVGAFLFIRMTNPIILKIRESESKFRNLIETAHDLVWKCDTDGRLSYLNPAWERTHGFTVEEMLGRPFSDFQTPEVFARDSQLIEKQLAEGKVSDYETTHIAKSGKVIHLLLNMMLTYDAAGKIIGTQGSAMDITRRLRNEEIIRNSEEKYRNLFEHANDSIFIVDSSTYRFLDANENAASRLGYTRNELLKLSTFDITTTTPDHIRKERMDRIFIEGGGIFETEHVRKDGTIFPVEISTKVIVVGEKKVLQSFVRDLTRRKEFEEKMRNSEEKYKRLVESTNAIVWEYEIDNDCFSYVNPQSEIITGYSPDEWKGIEFWSSIIHDDDRDAAVNYCMSCAQKGEDHIFEYRMRTKNGEIIWVRDIVTLITKDEKPFIMRGVIIDITEKQLVSEELKNRERIMKQAEKLAHFGSLEIDVVEKKQYWSDEIYSIIGYEPHSFEPTDKKFMDLLHTEDRHKVLAAMENSVKTGRNFDLECRLIRKDGAIRTVHAMGEVFQDPSGRSIRVTGNIHDITERKQAEDELRESETRLRMLTDWVPGMISYVDREKCFRFSNETHARWLSSTPEEIIGKKVDDVWSPQAYALMESKMERVFAGEEQVYETEYIFPDGKTRFMRVIYIPDKGEDGEVRGYATMAEDITTRRQYEEQLQFDEQRFKDFAESASDWFWEMGPDLKFSYFSPRVEEIVGVPIEFHLGKTRQELAAFEEDPKHWERHFKDLEDHRPFHDFRYWRKGHDGRRQYLSTSGKPIFGDKGNFLGYRGIGRDLTTEKSTEELIKFQEQQLIQADKMTSLGILVSGVAHEINNPNNFIMFNTPLLAQIWEDVVPILKHHQKEGGEITLAALPFEKAAEAVSRLLSGITSGAERIGNIVANLKGFASQDVSNDFQPVNINDVLESTMMLLTSEINKSTRRFSLECGEGIPPFQGNFQKMEQVVVNLITNACQALPDMDKAVRVKTEYDAKTKRIRLTVADEGEGISPENLSKIMDPFFTTKRDSGGTGLGLSVSFSIIEDHQGFLEFSSTEGEGTTAIISLPVLQRTGKNLEPKVHG